MATSSMLQLELVLSIIKASDMPAPLAVARSPSGWAFMCDPAGQMKTGMLTFSPNTVVEMSRSPMSRRKRGRRVRDSKADRLRRVVNMSMAPASMVSQSLWGSVSLARSS